MPEIAKCHKLSQIEIFAKKCGVKLFDCGVGWRGRIGFYEADNPNVRFCGYRTEKAAYVGWFIDKFGATTGEELMKVFNNGGIIRG